MTLTSLPPNYESRAKRFGPNATPLADQLEYTTGQVAWVAGVAPRTVAKWFDAGKLEGYRIPGSRDRRVPRAELVKFLLDNGMQIRLPRLGYFPNPVALGVEVALPGPPPAGWSLRLTNYAAGLLAAATDPAVMLAVVHASVGMPQAREFAAAVRGVRSARPPRLVLVVGADAGGPAGDWLQGPAAGYDLVLQEPIDPAALWAAAAAKATVAS